MRFIIPFHFLFFLSVALVSCDSGSDRTEEGGDLPLVLVYGDSIRGGYESWVRKLLSEEAEVWTPGLINGKGSVEMLVNLTELPSNDSSNLIPGLNEFAVLCINAGIWDGSRFDPSYVPTTVDQYQQNFIDVLNLVFERNPTAEVILVTSTPPNPAYPDYAANNARLIAYNEVLQEMATVFSQVSVCDLYAFVVENMDDTIFDGGVHFTRDFSRELGGQVYFSIHEALRRRSLSLTPSADGG